MFWKIQTSKLTLGFLLYFVPTIILSQGVVENGTIYLEKSTKVYHLTGTWSHKKETGKNYNPDPSAGNWEPITVPGIWKNIGIQHDGPIWYKLEFRLYRSLANQDLGLMIPNTAFAHQVFLNGKFIDGVGEFNPDGSIARRSTQMNMYVLPKEFILPKGKNTVLVRVGSYGSVGGFNLSDIYIGEKDRVQEKFLRYLLWNTILIAIFLFVGIYHFIMYVARPKDKEYLYYFLLCFTLAIFNLSFSTLSYWVWDNFWFYYFGTSLSVTLLPIWVILFFHRFLEYRKHSIAYLIMGFSVFLEIMTVALNVTGPDNFSTYNDIFLPILLGLLVISLVYPIYYLFRGIRDKKIGSIVILLGFVIFALASINDILNYLRILNLNIKFVDSGFLAFIITISFAMAIKFAHVHNELEYLTKNLSLEVEKRTRELSASNKRLLEIDKMKTSFFANVTHELRTPLTLSLLPLEKAMEGKLDKKTRELLDTSHRNNIKLLKLINDLLDYAKIEAGLMSIRLIPTNISSLLDGLTSHFRISAESKDIQLEIDIQDSITAPIDPDKTEKVIANLLSNAYKFTPKNGKIWISLKETIRSNGKQYACITIADNGIGIPEDKLDSIFERFNQLDMSKERNYEGSGIGLSLVKELTELQDGYVEVNSVLHEGSEFRIYLPINQIEKSNSQETKNRIENKIGDLEPALNIDSGSSFSMQVLDSLSQEKEIIDEEQMDNLLQKILVVEDNQDMLNLLKKLLHDHYHIVSAKNGLDGYKKAQIERPDLILSDVMMPGYNGFELTRMIKEDPNLRSIPIVLLTALNDLDGKIEGFNKGADDYISKPFQPLELLARIRNLLVKSDLQLEKNKRLLQLQKELVLARDIQSKLLPTQLPDIKGYNFAALYIPLDEVGGDFYDIYEKNDKTYIFICDVSGHGVPACLIASMVKMVFQSEMKKNVGISRIMKGINSSLYSIIGNNFVTACIVELDPQKNSLKYTTAGHPPFYHVSKGRIQEHKTIGKPLGVLPNANFEESTIYPSQGDIVFLYTDGIVECMNQSGEFYGEERLEDFLTRSSEYEPKEIIEALREELKGFLGQENYEDDITAFTVAFNVNEK
ncbi:SpoIIE family protein phosphatase [Leptospira sp. GIMC2001]|uniref:SpoIIE family protein phosphatase n=1 Tax=Leptospira sp. GIMC2001 TaxID=1513297 RepID=UPI00234A1299|nr:SpoIIE family protein phosphatase [Leptospira sp. GIMC2001]WCL50245.1 SpoIIE family protein phosphatase [Leptospira sp. GIMC2001]